MYNSRYAYFNYSKRAGKKICFATDFVLKKAVIILWSLLVMVFFGQFWVFKNANLCYF